MYYTFDDALFIVPADGSQFPELVFTNRHDARIDVMQGISWSPDGKKVAFGKTPWSDIFIFSLGSSDAVDITPSEKYFDSEPAWSPNGKLIAFTSDRRTSKGSTNIDLYTMRTDGSGIKLLFECSGWCRHPEWSPDGKNIVFQMDDDLYVINADGSKPRKLTNGARNEYAAWSPDGQWIAFTRSAGDNSYIYLVKPDGSGLRALTSESSGPRQLTWSPDGKYIAFENFPPSGYSGFFTIRFLNVQTGDTFDRGSGYAPSWQPLDLSKLPTSTAIPTSAAADCTSGWTRLQVGGSARVSGSAGDTPNRVRDAPSKSANQIGLLAPGSVMTLLEGPVCADGLVFWKVASTELPGGEGWTAEGDGKEYWLEPY
jgi:hypothetical protein